MLEQGCCCWCRSVPCFFTQLVHPGFNCGCRVGLITPSHRHTPIMERHTSVVLDASFWPCSCCPGVLSGRPSTQCSTQHYTLTMYACCIGAWHSRAQLRAMGARHVVLCCSTPLAFVRVLCMGACTATVSYFMCVGWCKRPGASVTSDCTHTHVCQAVLSGGGSTTERDELQMATTA